MVPALSDLSLIFCLQVGSLEWMFIIEGIMVNTN